MSSSSSSLRREFSRFFCSEIFFRAVPRRLSGAVHFVPHLFIAASAALGVASSCLHRAGCTAVRIRTGAFFHSAPTELEPYSRLNRTICDAPQVVRFSTSRQGTPHFVSGERYFFVIRCHGLCASCRDCGERSDFKVVFTPPRCLRPFSDTKKDCRIFPTKEPSDFFFRPYGVKKFTPPDGRGTLKKFLEKNHRNRLVRVQRNGQTDKPSACVI